MADVEQGPSSLSEDAQEPQRRLGRFLKSLGTPGTRFPMNGCPSFFRDASSGAGGRVLRVLAGAVLAGAVVVLFEDEAEECRAGFFTGFVPPIFDAKDFGFLIVRLDERRMFQYPPLGCQGPRRPLQRGRCQRSVTAPRRRRDGAGATNRSRPPQT